MKIFIPLIVVLTVVQFSLARYPVHPARFYQSTQAVTHPSMASELPHLKDGAFSLWGTGNRQMGLAVSCPYFQLMSARDRDYSSKYVAGSTEFTRESFSIATGTRLSDYIPAKLGVDISLGLEYRLQSLTQQSNDSLYEDNGYLITSGTIMAKNMSLGFQVNDGSYLIRTGYTRISDYHLMFDVTYFESTGAYEILAGGEKNFFGLLFVRANARQLYEDKKMTKRQIFMGTSVRFNPYDKAKVPGGITSFTRPFRQNGLEGKSLFRYFYDFEVGFGVLFDTIEGNQVPSFYVARVF